MTIPEKESAGGRTPYNIPRRKKLIIVDAHDTVLGRDLSRSPEDPLRKAEDKRRIVWQLREGFLNFLDYYGGIEKKKIVISSDGGRSKLNDIFRRFGVSSAITAVYGNEHIHRNSYLKQLDLIMNEIGVTPAETLFIGDSVIDQNSAREYGVDFIQVPSESEDRGFSFNEFLHHAFAGDNFGLEIQKIVNVRRIFRNLSSAELIEEIVRREEGRLGHLGPLVVNGGEYTDHVRQSQYIVQEPSSESRVYWEGEFRPFDAEKFHLLYLRMLAFLQDREIFIQDCFIGADPRNRFSVRVITQTGWHSLFARNTFIQPAEDELARFIPEITVIDVPNFQTIPEVDGTGDEAFVILNLARKMVLIGGTAYAGEMRRAVFLLIGYFFASHDMLPLICSANRDRDEEKLTLFFGETTLAKSALAKDDDRLFFGDAHHCWTREGVFNLEWGCYPPVARLTREASPPIYGSTRRFATILENVYLDERRKTHFRDERTASNARASFPITHLQHVDRKGVGPHPDHLFIIVQDHSGILPMLARLSPEQAVVFLLLGYSSRESGGESDDGFPGLNFRPFFRGFPFLFEPARYAHLFWERILLARTDCWLLNSLGVGPPESRQHFLVAAQLNRLTRAVHKKWIEERNYLRDPEWGYRVLRGVRGFAAVNLDPRLAWEDQNQYHEWQERLAARFAVQLQSFQNELLPELLEAVPPIVRRKMNF